MSSLGSVPVLGQRGKYRVGWFLYLENHFYLDGRSSLDCWAPLAGRHVVEVGTLVCQSLLGHGGFLGPLNLFALI